MYNETKKACNDRYLKQFKPVSLRIKPEELDAIKAAAATAGQSVHAFIMDAVRARMAKQA